MRRKDLAKHFKREIYTSNDKEFLLNIYKLRNKDTWEDLDYLLIDREETPGHFAVLDIKTPHRYVMFIERTEKSMLELIKDRIRQNLSAVETEQIDLFLEWLDNVPYISLLDMMFSIDWKKILPELFEYEIELEKKRQALNKKLKGKKNITIDIRDILEYPILDILDIVGIKYDKVGTYTYALYEGGVRTDGWRADTYKNIVTDFSGKGRAQGNPFSFIKQYYNLSDYDTFKFFEDLITKS